MKAPTLTEFNSRTEPEIRTLLNGCVRIRSWVDDIVAGRPYGSRRALLAKASSSAATWADPDVDTALADHPRIGDTPTHISRREQAGVSEDTAERFALANERYEQRFGRIFLVRATDRTGEELLDLLEHRLENEPDVEREITRHQLAEIALLRLQEAIR